MTTKSKALIERAKHKVSKCRCMHGVGEDSLSYPSSFFSRLTDRVRQDKRGKSDDGDDNDWIAETMLKGGHEPELRSWLIRA